MASDDERTVAKPFAVRTDLVVIEGGWLKDNEPWVLNDPDAMQQVGGSIFIHMTKDNRKLARAFGCDMDARAPWENSAFLNYLSILRNRAVDGYIYGRRQRGTAGWSRPSLPQGKRARSDFHDLPEFHHRCR